MIEQVTPAPFGNPTTYPDYIAATQFENPILQKVQKNLNRFIHKFNPNNSGDWTVWYLIWDDVLQKTNMNLLETDIGLILANQQETKQIIEGNYSFSLKPLLFTKEINYTRVKGFLAYYHPEVQLEAKQTTYFSPEPTVIATNQQTLPAFQFIKEHNNNIKICW